MATVVSAAEIPPGGEGKIKVKVSTRGRKGNLQKSVVVQSNDPKQPRYNLKIKGMVRLALCVAYGALTRTESRGCHAREDYEARNDRDWLNRTLATWREGDDLPTLNYEPATQAVELPPGERGYGVSKIISGED